MDKKRRNEYGFIALLVFIVMFANYLIHNFSVIPSTLMWFYGVFKPFILGLAFAFIINVVMKRVESKLAYQFPKFKKQTLRVISLLLSLVFIIGLLCFVVFLVAPEFVKAIGEMVKILPDYIRTLSDNLTRWFNDYPDVTAQIQNLETSWQQVGTTFLNSIAGSAAKFVGNTITLITSTVSVLINIFIALAFSIYVLLSKETLKRHFKKLMFSVLKEETANYILDFFTLSNHAFSNFLTGQLTEAFINGLLTFLGCVIFRFPYAPVISVLVGFSAMIPYFGAIVGTLISFFLVASQGITKGIIFLVYQIIVQQIDGNFIYPRVVGNQIGLPAIWVMVSVTTGANVAGFVGMVLFVPLASILYVLLVMFVNRRLEKKKLDVSDIKPRSLGMLFPKKDGSKDQHTI